MRFIGGFLATRAILVALLFVLIGLGTSRLVGIAHACFETSIDDCSASPSISTFSPTIAAPGDRVTIFGDHFDSLSASSEMALDTGLYSGVVPFSHRLNFLDIGLWTSSSISFTVPANLYEGGNYYIYVAVDGRPGVARSTIPLEVESNVPEIASVSPAQVNQGGMITVIGKNFGSNQFSSLYDLYFSYVRINSFDVLAWNDTHIQFKAPAGVIIGSIELRPKLYDTGKSVYDYTNITVQSKTDSNNYGPGDPAVYATPTRSTPSVSPAVALPTGLKSNTLSKKAAPTGDQIPTRVPSGLFLGTQMGSWQVYLDAALLGTGVLIVGLGVLGIYKGWWGRYIFGQHKPN